MSTANHIAISAAEFLPYRWHMAEEWTDEETREAFLDDNATGILVDGECIAVAGVRYMHIGLGEAYLLMKPGYRPGPHVAREMRKYFQGYMLRQDRVQTRVNLYDPSALRFNQWLGMRPEGIQYEWGPAGETYVIFVSIKGVDR